MSRLFQGVDKPRKSVWGRLKELALTDVRVAVGGMDHESLETLEERLITADFGVTSALKLVSRVETLAREGKIRGSDGLREALRAEIEAILDAGKDDSLAMAGAPPTVYLIVGVNGVGKTTSVAKLAHRFVRDGRSVLLAAADTFRAGATRQLEIWAERVGANFVGGQRGGDPAAVAFDAIEAAEAREVDVVLIDTAGRLHTRQGLMDELGKIDRVVRKRLPGGPHESLIVLDATVGQNAVQQVRAFGEVVDLTGIILAKADSTARGGFIVALQDEFDIPVKLVGTGESREDLDRLDRRAFADAVLRGS